MSKSWRRPLSLALLLCGGLMFSGLTQAAETFNSRLDSVIQSGKLRVCMTGDYKPFTYYKADNSFEGMDVDLARELGKTLGAEVQLVKTTWPTLMSDFLAQCDIAMGGVSVTLGHDRSARHTRRRQSRWY